ncbi:MAG: hypothetical protein JWM64_482 [Frankiales bacterium]|nr:hypothetical protein [Frankiales bacterium]
MTAAPPFRPALRAGLRVVRRRRGLIAAGLTAAAVASALPTLAPPVEPGTVVLAAARDLPAGAVLVAADVVRLELPARARPEGALADGPVDGLRLAGPVRRGEALTDVRLLGAGLLGQAGDGLVASPVRLADPAGAALVRAGDRVDVLAAAPDGGAALAPTAASDVLVLAVPAPDEQVEGGLLVLATTPATASRLAAAAVSSRLSVVLRAQDLAR